MRSMTVPLSQPDAPALVLAEVGRRVLALLPVEVQIALVEVQAGRLTGSIAVNFKEGVILSSDHRPDWPPAVTHREYPRSCEARRTEHRDLAG